MLKQQPWINIWTLQRPSGCLQTEVAREPEAIRTDPATEQGELIRLLEHEGVATDHATQIVQLLVRYPQAYHKTMMEKELGLQLETDTAKVPDALTMGVSYIAGSIFPLARTSS